MTVYVDDMEAVYGRMKMCHMLADSDEELHAMAARIGVAQKWWQSPLKTSGSHYDIALTKKALALAAGAKAITYREAGAMNTRRRATGQLGSPATAVAWARAYVANKRKVPIDFPEAIVNTGPEPVMPSSQANLF